MIESTNEFLLGMTGHGRFSQVKVLRELQQDEQYIYAILTREGAIKIGITTDLATRKRGIKFGGTRRILAFRPGDIVMERDIHASLSDHRIYGVREYYYPVPGVIAKVNWMCESFGLPLINRHHLPRLSECTFHRRVMEQQARDAAL